MAPNEHRDRLTCCKEICTLFARQNASNVQGACAIARRIVYENNYFQRLFFRANFARFCFLTIVFLGINGAFKRVKDHTYL